MNENNRVVISGVITSLEKSFKCKGENFYSGSIEIQRTSGFVDVLPVLIPGRLLVEQKNMDFIGSFVKITGSFRSYNKQGENGKNRLILYVFSEEIIFDYYHCFKNYIELNGTICKHPVYRLTPKGREISELLLAVNRSYRKSDYIPCICWGRNAKYAESLNIGTSLKIEGRIQSRTYNKKQEDGQYQKKTAYEISISAIEEVDKNDFN